MSGLTRKKKMKKKERAELLKHGGAPT